MPFLSGSLGADDGQGALLLQQEFVEVRNPLWGSQVTQVPGDTRPKESGTSQGHGMISQSSSLMGSNTPRLRVQAGSSVVHRTWTGVAIPLHRLAGANYRIRGLP